MERGETNPQEIDAHRETTQEAKDRFLLLIDELTESGYFSEDLGVRMKSVLLPDGRDAHVSYRVRRSDRPFSPNQDVSKLVLNEKLRGDERAETIKQRSWTLRADNVFEKFDTTFELPIDDDWDDLDGGWSDDRTGENEKKQLQSIGRMRDELERAIKSEKRSQEMGLTRTTEVEAQEAIRLLLQIQSQIEEKGISKAVSPA